ncbi:MAG: transcription regulator [Ilumatobacteraceae bacterium]|nr:transcription regulator [Ilumatobacteraceae bacterium]
MTSHENPAAPPHVGVVANTDKLRGRDVKRLRAALHDAGYGNAPWIEIAKGSEAKKAARKAVRAGAEVVLVCGGDGSVRAAAEALVDGDVALAVLPAGTANLFAGAFDLPSDPKEVVDLIRAGGRRTIDTGECNGQTFAVMAGAGFDAAMIDSADDQKERLGTIAYVRAGVHEARTREVFEARVAIDGSTFFEGPATCVLVGNIGTLKGGVQAFPDASVTDGLLDVAVVTAAGMREWAALMLDAVRHRQRATAHAQLGRGADIVVELDRKHRYELDGGMKGRAKRLRLSAHPHSLVVCTPTPAPT